jgi:hypothetical protein
MAEKMKTSSWRLNDKEIAHIAHALKIMDGTAPSTMPKEVFGHAAYSKNELQSLIERFVSATAIPKSPR